MVSIHTQDIVRRNKVLIIDIAATGTSGKRMGMHFHEEAGVSEKIICNRTGRAATN